MKKWIKLFGLSVCMIVGMTIFSACDFSPNTNNNDDTATPPVAVKIPSDIEVTGYDNNIVVGEEFISKLKVRAKFDGEWEEVVKADYSYTCSYTGSKYGEYAFNVYLKEYPSVEYSDIITVNPKTIELPASFSTKYTGEIVDIKAHYQSLSNDLYDVKNYMNMSNVGDYEVTLKLINSDVYVWTDAEGNILKNSAQKLSWSITKASPKPYTGVTNITAYYGDTLYDLLIDNHLNNITWHRDVNNNSVNDTTIVTEETIYYAYYNENPLNYENTPVTIIVDEVITTANYSVQYYFFDGGSYVINEDMTKVLSGNIGEIVEAEVENVNGYVYNSMISNNIGRVIKKDGLILKLYYDVSE